MTLGDEKCNLVTVMGMAMAGQYRLPIDRSCWQNLFQDREPVADFAAPEDFCRRVAVKLAGWSEDDFNAEVASHIAEGFVIRFVVNGKAMLIVTVPLRDPVEDRRAAKKIVRGFIQNGQRELAKLAR